MAEIRINTTGGLKLYDADNSHYAQIVAGTITSNVDAITLGHDTVTIADNLSLGSDSAILKFGADTEIALTHVADTGLKLTDSGGTPTLQLHDANESIASDGSKVIITSGGTAFSLPTSDGSSGQVLSTNGSGVLSFATASSADPSSADGDSLGTASAEWSDLFLADGGIIYFGNDQDVTLTHDPDDGLFLKSIATADNNPVLLTLQTGETDMAADDVIGKIAFQAPDEGTGTDAILVSAAIQAVAEGDHSSSSNATRLEFMTGASEAATAKMTLSSAGLLRLGGSTSPDAAADNLVMQGSGDTGMSIFSGGSDKASIFLGADGANNDCKFEYDNNANSLVIHTNATEAMKIDTNGHITKPKQTAFCVFPSGDQSNLAVDQDVTIAFGSERFDRNADFGSNVFTAPVTGVYQLNIILEAAQMDGNADTYSAFHIKTSNHTYRHFIDYNSVQNDSERRSCNGSILCDMDASDTAFIEYYQNGGSAQLDIIADETLFSGYLVA
jgi:hypothetical protein